VDLLRNGCDRERRFRQSRLPDGYLRYAVRTTVIGRLLRILTVDPTWKNGKKRKSLQLRPLKSYIDGNRIRSQPRGRPTSLECPYPHVNVGSRENRGQKFRRPIFDTDWSRNRKCHDREVEDLRSYHGGPASGGATTPQRQRLRVEMSSEGTSGADPYRKWAWSDRLPVGGKTSEGPWSTRGTSFPVPARRQVGRNDEMPASSQPLLALGGKKARTESIASLVKELLHTFSERSRCGGTSPDARHRPARKTLEIV